MIKVTLICVGRLKDRFFEEASAEYLKRLSSYAKTEVIEVKAEVLPDNPNDTQINNALKSEGDAIIKKIPSGACVVPMCIEGKEKSSEELAGFFEINANSGISHFVFIIGGSYGLSDDVKKLGKTKLSMSRMTFPHRLARVMLLEQIYRACKINAGEKYHK